MDVCVQDDYRSEEVVGRDNYEIAFLEYIQISERIKEQQKKSSEILLLFLKIVLYYFYKFCY